MEENSSSLNDDENIEKKKTNGLPDYIHQVLFYFVYYIREYRGNSCHHLEWANKGQRDNYTMANCPTSRLAARHNEIISRSLSSFPSVLLLSFVPFFSGARLGVLNSKEGGERERSHPREGFFSPGEIN